MKKQHFLKPKYYRIPRIEKLLDVIWKTQVLFVTAPFGCGKSTIVREYLESKNRGTVSWFYFDQSEDARYVWWEHLAEQMRKWGCSEEEIPDETYLNKSYYELCKLVDVLKRVMKEDMVVVFEDYHLYNKTAINQLFEIVSQLEVPKLHFIILQRKHSDLPYHEMQLKGSCELIEKKDFYLTEEEIKEFFSLNGFELTEKQLKEITEFTGGWISAVYLLCLSYMQQEIYEGKRNVLNLVKYSIYQRLDKEEQQVLLCLAQLEYCKPEQAVYLTGKESAAQILYQLQDKNGFVSYSDDRGFSMHTLLRRVVEEEALKNGFKKRELLEKNVQYLILQGEYLNALRLCCELEKYEEIFEILEAESRYLDMIRELRDIYKIMLKIPIEVRIRHLKVYVHFVTAYILKEDYEAGTTLQKEIIYNLEEFPFPHEDMILMCQLTLIITMVYFNDISKMKQHVVPMVHILSSEARALYREEGYKLLACPSALRLFYNEVGKLDGVMELIEGTDATIAQEMLYANVDAFTGFRMEYDYETGNMEAAMQEAEIHLQAGLYKKNPITVLHAYNILMHCDILYGKREKLEQRLEALSEFMQEIPRDVSYDVYSRAYELLLGKIFAITHKEEKMKQWVVQKDVSKCNSIVRMSGYIQMIEGHTLINNEKYLELGILGSELLEDGVKKFAYRKVYGMLYIAISQYHLGQQEEAINLFRELVELCKKDHLLMPLVENAEAISEMLSFLEKNEFVEELTTLHGLYMRNAWKHGYDKKVDSLLTERESEIMELVSQGKKNNEIANELHIAQVTVEKALSNVYRKMGVKNRAGAIQKWNEELQ